MAFSEQGEALCGSGSSASKMHDVTRNQVQEDAHSCAKAHRRLEPADARLNCFLDTSHSELTSTAIM